MSHWTDHSRNVAGIIAAYYGQLNGFLGTGEKFGSSASCGSRLDVHIAILGYPAAEPMV